MSDIAQRGSQLFVIMNPAAGSCSAEEVHRALERHFPCDDGTCDVHRVTGEDNLEALARAAAERGCDVVVAAGGDGTVSAVAGGLVGTEARLGILPLGTGNVLARELGIPVDLEAAVGLLAGANASTPIDAMRVGDRHFFTQLGVGIDALMIRDTSKEQKKRFGRLAYIWTGLTRILGFQPRRFTIEADGRRKRLRASQVLAANSGTLGQPPFRWGPDIRPDDGRIDLCIIRAGTLLDYLALSWSVLRGRHRADPHFRFLVAERRARIESARPLPVQADGEIIGETPVEVEVIAGAVKVVVPEGDRPR
jgi:YegS/Rv2252/BmrU family lipid kinase